MAFQAAANATQRVGNYAPGSLAAQPRRFAGGVRKRGESPDQMANRMDAGYMASAMQGGTSATTPTRADNIAKARADGTFDAKRNAFTAANSGSFMDAAGNIGPKAEMPTSPASAPPSPAPPSDGMLVPGPSGSSVWKTKAELDEQRKTKEMADARRRAGANTGGGMFGTVMRGVNAAKKNVAEIDTAKRKAFSRWRVQSEAYIHDPKWAEGEDPKDVAKHRASLMKTMAKEKERNEFMDVPHWYGDNVPEKTPQTAREWDEVGRKPFY